MLECLRVYCRTLLLASFVHVVNTTRRGRIRPSSGTLYVNKEAKYGCVAMTTQPLNIYDSNVSKTEINK
jgi:hypothetical protein